MIGIGGHFVERDGAVGMSIQTTPVVLLLKMLELTLIAPVAPLKLLSRRAP